MNQNRPESWVINYDVVARREPSPTKQSPFDWRLGDCFGQKITALATTLALGSLRNRNKLLRLEACSSNERAVNVGIGEELRRIGSRDGPAIQDADRLG